MTYQEMLLSDLRSRGYDWLPEDVALKWGQQESGFNPNAVSSKGAQGLLQVMPETGRAPGYGVTPMQDNTPQENIRFGLDYLNAMHKKTGNLPDALRAYNAGLGGNWDNPETRNYVSKIMDGQTVSPGDIQPYTPVDASSMQDNAMITKLGAPAVAGTQELINDPAKRADPSFMGKVKALFGDEEKMARIAIAFNSLRMNPDPNLAASQQKIIDNAQVKRGGSRTAAYLRGKGLADVADLLESGAIDAKTALSYMKGSDPTALQQNYQFAVNQGYAGTLMDYLKDTKAGGTTVNVDTKGEGKYGEEIGKGFAEMDMATIQSAQSAASNIPKLNQTLELLDKGEPTTGFAAEFRNDIDRVFSGLGGSEAAGRASDTQILNALLGSDVFPMIKQLGIGARGLDTPAEREFLREVMTGTIAMEGDALQRLTKLRKKYAIRSLEAFNDQVESGAFDRMPEGLRGRIKPYDIKSIDNYRTLERPSGVTAQEWSVMTPEEKALFQ